MSEKKSSGPSFLISKEEKRLQESIRQSEAAPSATPQAGTRGTKDNSECASRRIGNLPQAEQVRDVVPQPEGTAIECARKQNEMDDGQLAQQPAGKNFPTRVTPS